MPRVERQGVAFPTTEVVSGREDLSAGLTRLHERVPRLAKLFSEQLKRTLKRWIRLTPLAQVRDRRVANLVRRSEFFDAEAYLAHLGDIGGIDPARHYVTVGEQLGIAPSKHFDPLYYGDRYPDVVAAEMCLLAHYIQYGWKEGRLPRAESTMIAGEATFSPDKETILLVSHEASRTGAPVLALAIGERLSAHYNVISILMRGGSLTQGFARISTGLFRVGDDDRIPAELRHIARSVSQTYAIRYALLSSIESRDIVPFLGEALIPTVNLIHEFSSYTRPLRSVRESLGWTTELLFSTNITAESFRNEHRGLERRELHVLPQGRCKSEASRLDEDQRLAERARLRHAMRPKGAEDALVVLGAGVVHIRKGIDLFLAAAASALRLDSQRKLRFVWIGHGYDPTKDTNYSVYLVEQIKRSGLDDHFVLLDEISDLEPAYALSDVFFLSSRLDPLPNVTIEAAMHAKPVLCFAEASGMAEILQRDSVAGMTVVPYLDTGTAARRIVDLAQNPALRQRVGEATRALAERSFDMDRYVERVDAIGGRAVKANERRRADFETIRANPLFDERVFLPRGAAAKTREAAMLRYLAYWSAARTAPRQLEHLDLRRPFAGFNPQIYAQHHPELVNAGVDPLADYIRRNYPTGPWVHDVIRPDAKAGQYRRSNLRAAMHAHFHYPELIGEFLDKMSPNMSRVDLFLSTDTEDKALALRKETARLRRSRVEVRVVPNRGRDIGPFFTAFGPELGDYEVIGHFHGKRSTGVDGAMGVAWREFLWQHLLGSQYPMIDIIMAQFSKDEALGVVFAEEPHLCDWDNNLEIAEEIAKRAGLKTPLPPFFEFPVGTMFWARPRALAPLFDLKLDWEDYPVEPLANDGTLLHALERLVPFAAESQGYRYATVHVPGITR